MSDGSDAHESAPDSKPKTLQNALENFSPLWFAIPMSTGVLAIILHQLPYNNSGFQVCSTILYLFELVQFILMGIFTIMRLALCPRTTKKMTANTPSELAAWSCPVIAFLLLASLTALIPSNAGWGGHGFSILAYVMYWIGVVWMLVTAFVIFATLFRTDVVKPENFDLSFCLPCVGIETVAVTGGVICNYGAGVSARLAVPVIIVSYMFCGLGLWLAVLVYAMTMYKFMHSHFPQPAKLPTLMLLAGPFGQAAAALQYLGRAAYVKDFFGNYNHGTFLTASAASSLSSASILLALLIFGFDLFWIALAVFVMLDAAFQRKLTFSLSAWGLIFPAGTANTALIAFAGNMDSPAFRVIATILFVILLIVYFANWAFTLLNLPSLLFQTTAKELARNRRREHAPQRVAEEEAAEQQEEKEAEEDESKEL